MIMRRWKAFFLAEKGAHPTREEAKADVVDCIECFY